MKMGDQSNPETLVRNIRAKIIVIFLTYSEIPSLSMVFPPLDLSRKFGVCSGLISLISSLNPHILVRE